MTALTVWKFDTEDGAEQAIEKLRELQKQQLIQIFDAAVVKWPEDRQKPKTNQAFNLVGSGALGGAFWGLLFGFIFFMPFLGAAVGAAVGALSGYFRDYGISDDFIKDLREKVTKGTSALFLLTGQVTVDKVRDEFAGDLDHAQLLQSNLSKAQEAKLREDFGSDEVAPAEAVVA
jgi:uncharacterized membrane protein